ncbi:MAG: carboxypeptidase regulatory-like domain-containing protein [Patescibacteria group bacterium]
MLKKLFKIKKVYFFMIFLLLGSFFVFTQPSKAIIIMPGGDISGQVTDSQTSNPLEGVTLQLTDGFDVMGETTSDSNGEYSFFTPFCNFPPGLHVVANFEGYVEQEITGINVPCNGGAVINISLVPEAPEINPVILVPGLMGSWNVPLSGWQIDPLLHTYDNLWEALKTVGCDTPTGCIYTENQNLFAFPYQWRVSNTLTAYDLMRKIDEVQQITGASKVDIISHSMGGLVTRYYIENELFLQDTDGVDEVDIDQVIFLGTPHQGATKSYLVWEAGEAGPDIKDYIMQRIFTVEADFNGYGSAFQYVHGLPMTSIQELLPTFDYLKDKDTGILRQYSNNYPVNTFLEDLNSPSKLDKMNLVRGLNIIGKMGNDSTVDILRVEENIGIEGEWEHGYPEKFNNILFGGDHGLEYAEGDETVPNRSNNIFLNWSTVELEFNHSDIVTEAQKIIIKELTGIEPIEMIKKNIFSKLLLIKVHSPVDFQIIDPKGNILGKDFTNSNILNQIPQAFYSGFDNTAEFALIPDPLDGEYVVNLMGTGDGVFELIVSNLNNDEVADSSVKGSTALNTESSYVFNYQQDSVEPVEIEEVIEEITIDDIIKDVEEIMNTGGLKNKWNGKFLLAQLKVIKKWDEKFNKEYKKRQLWIKNMYKRLILGKIKLMEKQLKYWLKKNKINQESYNILINDLNLLKLNYQE